jgi:multidrug transporter EmrE-like cation transporter
MILLLVLMSIGVGVVGQLLFKAGAVTPVHSLADLVDNLLRPPTISALVMYVASTLLWLVVVSRARLSYAYPLLGLNYALVVGASAWLLQEPVSPHRWIGVGFIVVGFVVAATS